MKAERTSVDALLKTARGQIDGLLKMVAEDQYCIDICNQILATQSVLRRANKEILRAHMDCCVKEAFEAGNSEQKIEAILSLLDKLGK